MHFSQPLALLVNSDCPYPIIFFFSFRQGVQKIVCWVCQYFVDAFEYVSVCIYIYNCYIIKG